MCKAIYTHDIVSKSSLFFYNNTNSIVIYHTHAYSKKDKIYYEPKPIFSMFQSFSVLVYGW